MKSTVFKNAHFRAYAKVLITCFLTALFGMYLLHSEHDTFASPDSILHALLLTAMMGLGFTVWVYPEHRSARLKGENETAFLQSLINAIPAPVFYKDENGTYLGCNDEFEDYIGHTQDEIIGKTVFEVAPEKYAKVYHEADMALMLFGDDQVYERSIRHADGTERNVLFHKAVYRRANGEVAGIIGIIIDITERKELERRLQSLATIDALTNLPNRRELDYRLEKALFRNEQTGERLALLYVDIDGFKDINDLYGHEAGDQVLIETGQRLVNLLRKTDEAGRVGGDKFAVILDTQVTAESAGQIAQKILTALSAPYHVGGHTFNDISACVGIALVPDDGQSLKTLLLNADRAMSQAKENGKHSYCFAQDLGPPI